MESLKLFKSQLQQVPDPRDKKGTYRNFHSILAVTILGLLANNSTIDKLIRWTKLHKRTLCQYFEFSNPPCQKTLYNYRSGKVKRPRKRNTVPSHHGFVKVLQDISLKELQKAFTQFVNAVLADENIVAAVDGKVSKQMKDEKDNPILMLNIFAQKLKVQLLSYSVHGDKTNEPSCLKNHLGELVESYPALKLLSGDAIFTQRPLLEAMEACRLDYVFQVKGNQPELLEAVKETFADAEQHKPNATVTKKRGESKNDGCGSNTGTRIMSVRN
jgi:hypothetical protein